MTLDEPFEVVDAPCGGRKASDQDRGCDESICERRLSSGGAMRFASRTWPPSQRDERESEALTCVWALERSSRELHRA